MDQAAAIERAEVPGPALAYDGRLGELYAIFWKNLLFTILTLGIFRFWAITRMRRYIWSRMAFQGERFEYTGTGGELFKGFLVAGGVLVGFQIVVALSRILGGAVAGGIVTAVYGLLIAVLAQAAYYSAQRYRLSRTLWMGVRGGMDGSALAYGARGFGYSILSALGLFIPVPWVQVALARRRIGDASFGSLQFRCEARSGPVYAVFLLGFFATVAGFAIMTWVLYNVFAPAAYGAAGPSGGPGIPADARIFLVSGAAVVLTLVVAPVTVLAWYEAALRRAIHGGTTLGPLAFSDRVTGRAMLWLYAGNVLILIGTLGLGFPITLHRTLRLTARTVMVRGVVDGRDVLQSTLDRPGMGEGFLGQLDAGGVF